MFITRKGLKEHFKFPKKLPQVVEFDPAKSVKLPRPLHKLRHSHYCTDLLNIGGNYRIAFVWKEREERKRCQIYAHLFIYIEKDKCLCPLARIDYHPSHK